MSVSPVVENQPVKSIFCDSDDEVTVAEKSGEDSSGPHQSSVADENCATNESLKDSPCYNLPGTENHIEEARIESDGKLSAFQKAKIENNRQKALLLRQARLQAHPYRRYPPSIERLNKYD